MTTVPLSRLDEIIQARVFRGTKASIARWQRKYKGRWDNESHFIRSAIIVFERELAKQAAREELQRKYGKVRR